MKKIPWNKPAYGEKITIYRKLWETGERWHKEMGGIPCPWAGRINMVKMIAFPKAI